MSITAGQCFTNQNLFSSNYLKNRLPETALWKEADKSAAQILQVATAAYHDVRSLKLGSGEEANLEYRFIRPVFKALGFECDVQPVTRRGTRKKRPDYALFASEADLKAAREEKDNLQRFFSLALTIAEAKYWDRPLNDTVNVDKLDSRDATAQLVKYLDDVHYHSNGKILWGILTNGRLWRLFYYRAASRSGNFYQVDLQEIIRSGNVDACKYFSLFFARDAFIKDAQTGRSWLEQHLDSSETYAKVIGEKLKDRIFDKVFERLAEGFLEYRRKERGITTEDEGTLTDVFNGCLTLLYRLLFILYAEARELLPVGDEHRYYRKSLRKLQLDVLDDLHRVSLDHMSRNAYDYWARLESLCRIIDKGDKALNVPTYNGGLFQFSTPDEDQSPEARAIRFIRNHKLADPFLAEAIEALTADNDAAKPGQHSFIDYSSLGVRHLGDIYEGLLEFHVRVAAVEMAEVREKGRAVWKSLSEVKNPRYRRKHPGEVYIENSRHERRATGSYFTPHYIVEYIVKHAVSPVLKERLAKVETLLEEYETLQKKVQRQKVPGTAQIVRRELLDKEKEIFDTLFSLKVLDPAMGSGHFLVHTVDFIADRIIVFLAEYPENPVIRRVEEMRAQILEDVTGRQGVEIDKAKLTDVNLIKRMVMKRCIYGVDLNPMAVELAKLSLWLDSFTLGAPLSFLDHHLKCGNSLIGARDVQAHLPPGSERRNEFLQAIANLLQVAEITDATASEVEQSRQLYREAIKWLHPTKERVNVQIARHFIPLGNEGKVMEWAYRAERKTNDPLEKPHLENFIAAQAVAADKRFFHWALEFPEVFFEKHGEKENLGFDTVIGNPPYGLITDQSTKAYTKKHFVSAQYQIDNYVAFMESALTLTKQAGWQSFIVPSTFLAMHYFSSIRRFMLAHCRIDTLTHYKFPVFQDPTVESASYVCQVEQDEEKRETNEVKTAAVNSAEDFVKERFVIQYASQASFEKTDGNDFNILLSGAGSLVEKLLQSNIDMLGSFCDIVVGLKPYQKGKGNPPQSEQVVKARVFDAPTRKDDTYKQYLMGRDIKRYVIDPLESRWISYGEWLAEPRQTAPFSARKKIILRQTGDSIIAALDDRQWLNLNNIHNLCIQHVPPSYEYLLAILNSKLITSFHQQVVPEVDRTFAEVKIVDLERLPIRRINFITLEKEGAQFLEKGKKLYERCLAKGDRACVLGFVEHALRQTPEQADIVHDLLAFLAGQMIEMNKAKQAEVRGFLGWLEREIGTKVEDLKNKTKLKDYHNSPFEVLLEVLKENHRALSIDPGERKFQDRLAKEYTDSLSKLDPLKAHLEATDCLIDQIVYKLYGLSKDEIAIVEGSASRPQV